MCEMMCLCLCHMHVFVSVKKCVVKNKHLGVRRSPGATTRWCSLSSAEWSWALLPLWWRGERALLSLLVLLRGDIDAEDDEEDEEDDDEGDDDLDERDDSWDRDEDDEDEDGEEDEEEEEDGEQLE